MTANRRRLAFYLPLVLLVASACGGGGSSGSPGTNGGLGVNVLWEQPPGAARGAAASDERPRQQAGGGFGPQLPGSVQSVRFVFESQSGYRCCVSIDPRAVPVDPGSGQRSVLLPNLPPGSATLEVAGFSTSVAAAPAGEAAACPTDPAEAGMPCSADLATTPSFASAAQPVTIVQGARSDAGDILVSALPFVVPGSLSPAPGQTVDSPVAVRFTVADAVTGVDRDSVAAAVDGDASAALLLQPCDDATAAPCSENGRLDVRGFAVERAAQSFSSGPKVVDIEARNQAVPVRSIDFSYSFRASAIAPTATRPTATPTSPPATSTGVPTRTPRPATATATRTAAPPTASPTQTVEPTPSATATRTGTSGPTPRTMAFIPAAPISVSTGIEFLLSTRLDSDTRSDLIIVSPESKEVNVLLGSALTASRFNPGTVFGFGTRLRAPALGDVDGDGEVDLLVPDDAENGIWVVIGHGDGTFGTPILIEIGQNPVGVAVIDLDRTGNLDIAVLDQSEDDLLLLTNDGGSPPVFNLRLRIPVARVPRVILSADFNHDNQADLAVLSEGDEEPQTLSVLLFEDVVGGFPVFAPAATVLAAERAESLTAADVDNDGFPDLVLLGRPRTTGNSDLVVVPTRPDGTPGEPIVNEIVCPFGTGSASCPGLALTVGDFDVDGNADVGAALDDPRSISEGDVMSVLAGRGDTTFAPATSAIIPRSPSAAAVGDFDGDGMLDIAVGGRRDSVVEALINVTAVGTGAPP